MMFVLDASVHLNALNPNEAGSALSQRLLERLFQGPWPIISPTLLLVEVAAAIARIFDDADRGWAVAQAIRGLPRQIWVPLDETLAEEAAHLAATHRLRGADSVYAAVARRYGAILITLDRQQLERGSSSLSVLTPADALNLLEQPS
jgi:predicted nucleic acid-binding protein